MDKLNIQHFSHNLNSIKKRKITKVNSEFILKRLEFEASRRRCSEFNLLHMSPDGACGYRAMAQGLSFLTNKFTNLSKKNQADIQQSIDAEKTERPKKCKENFGFINRLTTGNIKNNRHLNRNKSSGRTKMLYELNIFEETAVARYIQKQTVNWLIKNQDTDFNGIEGYKIKDLICETHNLSNIESYEHFYQRFAGLPDYIMMKTNGLNKSSEPIYKKKELPSRWCALPEQVAFCELFEVHIDIYTPQELKSSGKITPASFRPSDKSRLHHIGSVGNPINPTIAILQTINKGTAHYDYLISKKLNHFNYKTIQRNRNIIINYYISVMPKYNVILPVYYGYERNNPQTFEEFDRYTIMIALVSFMIKNSSFEPIIIENTKGFNLNKELKFNYGIEKSKNYTILTEKMDVIKKSKLSNQITTSVLKKKTINLYLIVVGTDYYTKTIKLKDSPESNIVLSSILRRNNLNWESQFYFYNNITGFNTMQNNIFKYVLERNTFLPSIKQLEEKEPSVIYGEDFENNISKIAGIKEIKKNIYLDKMETVKRMEEDKTDNQNLKKHPNFNIKIKNTTYELPHLEVIKIIKKNFLKTY